VFLSFIASVSLVGCRSVDEVTSVTDFRWLSCSTTEVTLGQAFDVTLETPIMRDLDEECSLLMPLDLGSAVEYRTSSKVGFRDGRMGGAIIKTYRVTAMTEGQFTFDKIRWRGRPRRVNAVRIRVVAPAMPKALHGRDTTVP